MSIEKGLLPGPYVCEESMPQIVPVGVHSSRAYHLSEFERCALGHGHTVAPASHLELQPRNEIQGVLVAVGIVPRQR